MKKLKTIKAYMLFDDGLLQEIFFKKKDAQRCANNWDFEVIEVLITIK